MTDLEKMERSRDHWRGAHRANRKRMERLIALVREMAETLEEPETARVKTDLLIDRK